MKKYSPILILLLTAVFAFSNCKGDGNYTPPANILKAFKAKYPQATRVEWEAKNKYQVVEFRQSGVEMEAWFDNAGNWVMTESDIPFTRLPNAVISNFNSGEYAAWRKEDVDKIERAGMQTVFVIEVEQGEQEVNLYYAEDGTLIKTLMDAGDNQGYQPLPQAIKDAVSQKYPSAKLLEANMEKGMWEIDILDNGKQKEIIFDNNNGWVSTSWDIRKASMQTEVPANVLNTLKSAYNQKKVDDIEFFETPTGNYYLFELDNEPNDIHIKIDSSGKILP